MTYEKALEQVKEYIIYPGPILGDEECAVAVYCARALEKQIKKKPILYKGRMLCPSCLKEDARALHHYCDNCGQAIDWSD